MLTTLEILKKYWGYDQFREKQEEIINQVIQNTDTLALLPTGGGKSICYQVPGLMKPGVCLVISPLIALMTDQVNQLKAKGISAVAIHSGMSKREIDIALDNAIYGNTKFLYVSPERLKTHIFKVRLEKMNVNLIAVDEAHCISEWGYDFRPAYLEIAELRKIKAKVPFLAVTATATADVIDDIQDKLLFSGKNLIKKSFERKNLTYNTLLTNNKRNRIEAFLKAHGGSGIIYCATRRAVKELCLYLDSKSYSVDYYHGGLNFEERQKKQNAWTDNDVQIMVSTNAFGMGIDKPDVRFVLHYDIPESLEAYYQEAGRGGRDLKESAAWLFYETEDVKRLIRKIELKYPETERIKKIYNALGNHFQLAIGSGLGETFPLDIAAFADKYSLDIILAYNALKFLELCNYIELSEGYNQPARLQIISSAQDLYQLQVKDKDLNKIVQFILRTEIGAFDNYVKLNEYRIAQRTGLSKKIIHDKLTYLHQLQMVDYIPNTNSPTITFLTERLLDTNLSISPEFHRKRKEIAQNKLNSVIEFIEKDSCKSAYLLSYFGEIAEDCGKCNSCSQKVSNKKNKNPKLVRERILEIGNESDSVLIQDLLIKLHEIPTKTVLDTLREMADYGDIKMDSLGQSFQIN